MDTPYLSDDHRYRHCPRTPCDSSGNLIPLFPAIPAVGYTVKRTWLSML
jgi:hypothetical protein